MSYEVWVYENSSYMDPDAKWHAGTHATYAQALAACRSMVAEYMREEAGGARSAAEAIELYRSFGPDPAIIGEPPEGEERFSAWDYAESIARLRWQEEPKARTDAGPPS